jgi:hypothetical protein
MNFAPFTSKNSDSELIIRLQVCKFNLSKNKNKQQSHKINQKYVIVRCSIFLKSLNLLEFRERQFFGCPITKRFICQSLFHY